MLFYEPFQHIGHADNCVRRQTVAGASIPNLRYSYCRSAGVSAAICAAWNFMRVVATEGLMVSNRIAYPSHFTAA